MNEGSGFRLHRNGADNSVRRTRGRRARRQPAPVAVIQVDPTAGALRYPSRMVTLGVCASYPRSRSWVESQPKR
jgi:hypothetical protein